MIALAYIGYVVAFVSALLFTLSGLADLSYGRWFRGPLALALAGACIIGGLAQYAHMLVDPK